MNQNISNISNKTKTLACLVKGARMQLSQLAKLLPIKNDTLHQLVIGVVIFILKIESLQSKAFKL